MNELKKAKELLISSNYTCVLLLGKNTFTSTKRGVSPLLELIDSKKSYKGYYAADKVVGKATAFLYTILDVKAVYASVISEGALSALKSCGILVEYGRIVKNIINRRGDGICPFEEAVLDLNDASAAYKVIEQLYTKMYQQPIISLN